MIYTYYITCKYHAGSLFIYSLHIFECCTLSNYLNASMHSLAHAFWKALSCMHTDCF